MKAITPYQLEVLLAVSRGNPPGEGPVDFDQLLERLSWKPKKESAQFTIRACITKGMLKKTALQLRRGRLRVCYEMTEKGGLVVDPRPPIERSLKVSGDSLKGDSFLPGDDLDLSLPDPGDLIE